MVAATQPAPGRATTDNASRAIRPDEAAALVVAVVLHAGLLWWLATAPVRSTPPPPAPIKVTLQSEALAPAATAPRPAPAVAPAPAFEPEPAPEPAPAPIPEPAPAAKVAPPKPIAPPPVKTVPRPIARPAPAPRPVTRPVPRPSPAPVAQPPRTRADPRPVAARPTPAPARAAPNRAAPVTNSRPAVKRIDRGFLDGVARSDAPASAPAPAAAIGPAVRASLSSAIARELKQRWVAPQGAEAERLVTILAWELNPDGSLAGAPRVVRQDGITEANRAQAPRHAEQAIRAVRLAAPFDLPAEFYPAWKRIAAFRFDRKLSQ